MSTFTLTDEEDAKIAEWRTEHRPNCDFYTEANGFPEIYVGAIGGGITYSFTPTGLGTITIARCACGAEIDVTNYDMW